MEKEKPKVVFTPKASDNIDKIVIHIEEKGYPETAEKFAVRLYEFAYSLSLLPNKYPVCRNKRFAKCHYHCAVFENNFVFVFKVVRKTLVIYTIIHCKKIRH